MRSSTPRSTWVTRSLRWALASMRSLWSSENPDYPERKYGPRARMDVEILSVTLITEDRAQVRLRKRLADEAGKPPYIVFSDAALRDMCAKRPATDEEFLEVSGVGATKLARYGEAFLSEIAEFEQGLANGR